MNKLKDKKLQITTRDVTLLCLLAAFMIIMGAYYFGYSNLNDKINTCEKQLTTQKAKLADLKEKNSKKEDYVNKTKTLQTEYSKALSEYANGTSEDATLMFLDGLEQSSGSWIKSTTFSTPASVYQFGKIKTSNPQNVGAAAYSTDMQGMKSTITIAYEASYNNTKRLITNINDYYSKNVIDNISMTYNKDTDVVTGTMTLSLFSITGKERPFEHPSVDASVGTDNIFNSSAFIPSELKEKDENGNYILSDYNFYMMFNSSKSDVDSFIIGKKDDSDGSSVIRYNDNSKQSVTITFNGSDGNYQASYSIGNVTYPSGNGQNSAFLVENSINILIMSNKRLESDDKSTAEISIINNTDKDVNVKVTGDDSTDPRVIFKENTGIVNTYR